MTTEFFKNDQKPKPKEVPLRLPKEIEADLDDLSKVIGRLHHQKVCLEAQINQNTNKMHQLLLEYDQALKKEADESPALTKEAK